MVSLSNHERDRFRTHPTSPAQPRPQAMLFTLWGDYVQSRGGEVWVGSLIQVAAEFGLSEPALRAVLTRMQRAGWLEATRLGKRSYYRLTPRGRAVIREGAARIFGRPRRQPWDGEWQLVIYSIPESQRELRDQFRKRLSYLGLGPLAAGTWLSPHDLRGEVDALAAELGATPYVEQFRGRYCRTEQARELAARVWPLESLAAAYGAFLTRWEQVAAESGIDGGVSEARAFVLRFSLIHEYQIFFLEDPDLPAELVPFGWPGHRAAEVFETLHTRLGPAANRFFDGVYEARLEPRLARAPTRLESVEALAT